ncbi:restriction endonuclease subunit M [Ligilactobacillus aviarius]|uniref:restriction endonuclease subunit M n=1 Tax=Ligilactobacillus aviarius TaxID=1606 RepID=UPI00249F1878|nr:restriction endonuclease subunit M [Ligilactobacillus aviarius]
MKVAIDVDVNEGRWSKKVLETLLIDRTTNKNIIWATNDYKNLGNGYDPHCQIFPNLITGKNLGVIQPRVLKTKMNQGNRTKKMAEVFTPSWICNEQNNLVDDAWFGKEGVFNDGKVNSWVTNKKRITFPRKKNKTWKKYVDDNRLEVACGEAPYLVSRYDTVTGDFIELTNRIGILDRKIRVINENATLEREWIKWVERAYQSVYGFEFQGDSLLIARENLLISYCDYYENRFNHEPAEDELIKIATIISWNLWQMDGLTYTVPYGKQEEIIDDGLTKQLSLFDFVEKNNLCIIKDWKLEEKITFKDLVEGE